MNRNVINTMRAVVAGLSQLNRVRGGVNGLWAAGDPMSAGMRDRFVGGIGATIDAGRVVVWSTDIWKAASAGANALIGTPVQPIGKSMVWVFDGIHPVNAAMTDAAGLSNAGGRWRMVATYVGQLHNSDDGDFSGNVAASVLWCPEADDMRIVAGGLGQAGELCSEAASQTLARRKFLDLPFVALDVDRGDRAERRRCHRTGERPPQELRVVTLRRRAAVFGKQQPPPSDPVADCGRTYHHQWIVTGHWRKQWYAARGVHEAIWIEPYMKGPTDAPLLAKRQTIYQAVR